MCQKYDCKSSLIKDHIWIPLNYQFSQFLLLGLPISNVSFQNTVNTIVRHCGPRFLSLQLPGFSLLLLDFIHAANAVICCSDLRIVSKHWLRFSQTHLNFICWNFWILNFFLSTDVPVLIFYPSVFQTPRTEAMSLLGSLLSFPSTFFQLPVLQPTAKELTSRPASDAKVFLKKDGFFSCLLCYTP